MNIVSLLPEESLGLGDCVFSVFSLGVEDSVFSVFSLGAEDCVFSVDMIFNHVRII
jgi:hypothetical protein